MPSVLRAFQLRGRNVYVCKPGTACTSLAFYECKMIYKIYFVEKNAFRNITILFLAGKSHAEFSDLYDTKTFEEKTYADNPFVSPLILLTSITVWRRC